MLSDNILVVCTGNVCRSPYIEFTLRHLVAGDLRITSAGTDALVGKPPDHGVAALLDAKGIDTLGFFARQLTADLVRGSTLVITATRSQRAEVVRLDPSGLRKTFALIDLVRRVVNHLTVWFEKLGYGESTCSGVVVA